MQSNSHTTDFLRISKGIDTEVAQKFTNKSYSSQTNVAIATAVTAKARIKLYRAIQEVTTKGAKLLYCDTDSLFIAVEKKYLTNFLIERYKYVRFDSSINGTFIARAVFAAPKHYALTLSKGEEIVRIAGSQANKITYDAFKQAFLSQTPLILENQFEIQKRNWYIKPVCRLKKINLHVLNTKRR